MDQCISKLWSFLLDFFLARQRKKPGKFSWFWVTFCENDMVHTHLQQKLKEGGFEPYKTGHVFGDLRCPVDHVDHCSWGSPKKTLLPRAMHVFPSSTCCASTWIQRIQRLPGVSSIIFKVQMFCEFWKFAPENWPGPKRKGFFFNYLKLQGLSGYVRLGRLALIISTNLRCSPQNELQQTNLSGATNINGILSNNSSTTKPWFWDEDRVM